MDKKKTEKLLDILNDIKDTSQLTKYVNSSSLEKNTYQLSEYILAVSADKGYGKSHIIKNASLYRSYGYEILSGKKNPSRDKLLKICIGNHFTLEEANRALTLAKHGILYAKDSRDSIIIYALNNNLNLMDTNFILNDHQLQLLGYS